MKIEFLFYFNFSLQCFPFCCWWWLWWRRFFRSSFLRDERIESETQMKKNDYKRITWKIYKSNNQIKLTLWMHRKRILRFQPNKPIANPKHIWWENFGFHVHLPAKTHSMSNAIGCVFHQILKHWNAQL